MSTNRAILRCSGCRHHVLDSFASLAGISIRSSPRIKPLPKLVQISKPNVHRSLSTSRRLFSIQDDSSESRIPSQDASTSAATTTSSTSSSSVPWYLQVQTPAPPAPSSRLNALEDIPPIPEDAPPVLHPLLSHLSTQIGLDNLTLLDLRSVYPPPALGSNLIMILGTARSYKHLNTSADRFCRWLRSKYKLAPYADGLLGRNELKLKLRRKARRMKLAQSVGNTVAMGATEGSDDGITTGWVCVNVGAVDAVEIDEDDIRDIEQAAPNRMEQEEADSDEDEYKNPSDERDVIGFGTKDARPRIVVQMFTEEKRLEMDLEGLWDVRVERREKKSERLDRDFGSGIA